MKSKKRKDAERKKLLKKSEAYMDGGGLSRYAKKLAFRNRVIGGAPLPFYMGVK